MSVHDKLIKARLTVYDLCQGKIKWTMSIPADPANDTDLIFMDALNDASDRIAELERQNAELRESLGEGDALRDKLAKLLSGVAVGLKGEELPLHRHGWHDLPELATVLRIECEKLRQQNAELVKALKDSRNHIMEWWEQESQELPPARSPEFVERLDTIITGAEK
jgi:hypothetical protein